MSRTTTMRAALRCPSNGTQTTEAPTPNAASTANKQVAERDTRQPDPPKAIGIMRGDVSGPAAPRHVVAIQRHARALGYQYIYTVRPPQDTPDPIGYTLSIAAGLGVTAIVVYDLACVDSQPTRVCEDFDLETVCPATTWARAQHSAPIGTCAT